MLAGGLITKAESDAWESMWELCPIPRDEVSEACKDRASFNVRARRAVTPRLDQGGHNILAHVMAQREAAIIRVEKVKVERVLANFISENPDSEIWNWIRQDGQRSGQEHRTGVRRVDPTYKNRRTCSPTGGGLEHTITFNEKTWRRCVWQPH